MEANEIETQLQIVHYSEQNQQFFFQLRKYQTPPPGYISFWITDSIKFKAFFKHLSAVRCKSQKLKISLSFLEDTLQKYQKKACTVSLMDILVQQATHVNNYN